MQPNQNQGHDRYQNRQYQPYVFRPNFMKNQDGEKKQYGRKVIDWTGACAQTIIARRFKRNLKDRTHYQPLTSHILKMETPSSLRYLPANNVTTRFVRTATNKQKCPVYQIVWTPDGRRLVTGAASGEFTLWNGMAFNFETILQAHDQAVRSMCWSRDGNWLATGDHGGYIKYWQQNMNNCCMFQAHKDQPCRGISFSPTDVKFASCSDDGTVRIWDFYTRTEEKILRGHGADVKQCDWHPSKGIVASGSKDLQSPIKLWDPKAGISITTLYAHKGTVMDIQWAKNGYWLASAARDHLVKVFDIRNLKTEYQILRGHKKEASAVAWHPVHEGLLSTGGSEGSNSGSIIFWLIGEEEPIGKVEGGHESLIWSMAWHPMGHVLATSSNDHSTKFWSRSLTCETSIDENGDVKNDIIQSITDSAKKLDSDQEEEEIPGLGFHGEPDDRLPMPANSWEPLAQDPYNRPVPRTGLTLHAGAAPTEELPAFGGNLNQSALERKKVYTKPVPKDFAKAWEKNAEGEVLHGQGGMWGGQDRGHHQRDQRHHQFAPYGGGGYNHGGGGGGGGGGRYNDNRSHAPIQHNPNSNYVQWDGERKKSEKQQSGWR